YVRRLFRLRDERVVGRDVFGFGAEDALNPADHVGRVGRRLHVALRQVNVLAAGDRAAELLDAVADLRSMLQLALNVGGQRLLDEIGADAIQYQAVREVVQDSFDLHAIGLRQAGDDLLFRDSHAFSFN